MPNFGLCENPKCKRFYRNVLPMNGLRSLMTAMNERERQNRNKSELQGLFADYLPFFQLREQCSDCCERLHPNGRPTDDPQLAELFNAGNELRVWEVF
jgi:hypothetical protein